MAFLILMKSPPGATEPQTYSLDMGGKPQLVIGRQKEQSGAHTPADIVIDDGKMSVSREHIIITCVNNTYYIKLKGRNPTFLNAQKLEPDMPARPLKNEDRLKICDFLFRFQDEKPRPKLTAEFLGGLPDPPEDPETGEVTTIQHSVNRASASEFLDVAPSERLRALLDISTKLASTLELDKLLPEIIKALFSIFKQADRAFVIQFDEMGRLYAKNFESRRRDTDDRFSKTIVRKCLTEMRGFLSEDASSDAALGSSASIAEFRIRSFMVVPLATTDGKALGALQLDTQDFGKKFREDDLKLLTVVANFASVAVEKANVHLALVDREKQVREMELARKVQLGFLPQHFPQLVGYDFMAYYNAAQTIGGDYYDFISLPDGRIAILLGDVAGKGVPASLLMAKLSAEARFCMVTQHDPAKAISLLNNNLFRGGIGDRFVTLAAMVLDPSTNTVTVVNAGHMTPLRYRNEGHVFGECVDEGVTGLPLGVMEGFEYESRVLPLEIGESLVVFTDGVTDAMNPAGVTFEMEGVYEAVKSDSVHTPVLVPKTIGERIVKAVQKHANGRAQNDDIAMVCFGRLEGGSSPSGTGTATNLNSR
jgi:serine phosphatase RsbU (regulator of sigma subunit)